MVGDVDLGMQTPVGLELVRIEVRSRWKDEADRDLLGLLPALDEALAISGAVLLNRVLDGSLRLQSLSSGRAYPGWDGAALIEAVLPTALSAAIREAAETSADGRVRSHFSDLFVPIGTGVFPWGACDVLVTTAETGEGSLISDLRALFTDRNARIALIILALTNPAADAYSQMKWDAEIRRKAEGQPCVTEVRITVSLDALRSATVEDINPHRIREDGSDPRPGICLLQALLADDDDLDPGPIDGKFGPVTEDALERFADRHGWAVRDERVYRRLLNNIYRRPG